MGTLEYEDRTCRIVSERNVGVISWREAPNLTQLHAHERIGKELARLHPSGTLLVNLVHSGTPNFTPEVTKETKRILSLDLYRLGVARVLLVGGLGGVAARAFLSTALLVSRSRRPTRVFPTIADAAEWCAAMLAEGDVQWTRAEVIDVCNEASRPMDV